MKFTVHTSLLALIFAVGVTDVFAAPAVRQLGQPSQLSGGFTGSNSEDTSASVPSGNMVTKPSASSAPSGITSSRAGSIRTNPTMRTNPSNNSVASVASGTGTPGRTASTSQRLSIGPYIGAPRQISSGGGGDTTEITNDIKNINNEIQNITNILEGVETDISGKVDIAQGTQYTGKALVVDTQGNVKPIGEFVTPDELNVDLDGKVDKDQGIGAAGHVLSVDADGMVTNANEVYYKPEMDTKLAEKVDILQGRQYKGKALVVDNDGKVKPIGVIPDDVNIDGKVDKLQGAAYANHVLSIDPAGWVTNTEEVYFKPEMDAKLAEKLDNTADPDLYMGYALVVNEDGDIVPADAFVKENQGTDFAQRVLTVDNTGHVKPDKIVYSVSETDTLLSAKLDNTADPEEHGGKVLIVDPDTGEIRPGAVDFEGFDVNLDGKVDKFQTTDNADTVLVVNEEGWVADEKIKNIHVADDAALERKKMAADITDTLDWVDAWKNQAEDATSGDYKLDSDARYVMALDEYGEKAWFRVVTTVGQ